MAPVITLIPLTSPNVFSSAFDLIAGLGGWRWGGFGNEATTTVENYRVGTLVGDM